MSAIPFTAWLRLAALHFYIPPREFWRLSLKEWRALNAGGEDAALKRSTVEQLIQSYPDKTHENR